MREERGEYSALAVQAAPASQAVYSQCPAERQLTSHSQLRAVQGPGYNGITDQQQFEPGQAQARDDEVL